MKTQTFNANARVHSAHAWRLLAAVLMFSLLPGAQLLAQNYAAAQSRPHTSLLVLSPTVTGATEDEFQSDLTATVAVSSNEMAGQPAESLPCEEQIHTNENDSLPPSLAAEPEPVMAAPTTTDNTDQFLVDKIQAVERMIRLMQLKEEIIKEKSQCQQELVNLQKKIERQ